MTDVVKRWEWPQNLCVFTWCAHKCGDMVLDPRLNPRVCPASQTWGRSVGPRVRVSLEIDHRRGYRTLKKIPCGHLLILFTIFERKKSICKNVIFERKKNDAADGLAVGPARVYTSIFKKVIFERNNKKNMYVPMVRPSAQLTMLTWQVAL